MPVVVGLPDPGRCLVMGVVNTTPDSFSDGGLLDDAAAGVAHGLQLVADGADLVDVGGESTRPGAERVDEAEEARRVLPVVEGLAEQGVVVSVDTMRASIARAAVSAGARLVNDVSGGLADPDMVPAMADLGVGYVVMHWRGHSTDMQSRAVYGDVVAEVRTELEERVAAVLAGGVSPERLIVDPGLGFAKQP
ncbi:MAG: dihydropteroate synthase, partial [Frankiales bacterium]|nr:dihydropteroate synthase [Frankiales bacterium]